MLAIAGMLCFASCTNDDAIVGSSDADYVSASFTVSSPELALGTRAANPVIGDGTKADMVVCAVFDMYNDEMKALRQYLPIENKAAKYSIRLAKGQDYRVVFFAYHASDGAKTKAEFYNITDLKKIEIYDANSNIEERDAFTAYYDVEAGKTMQPINENITLYRPFAQLNLGTCKDDWADAIKAGVEVAKTQIKVSNVYTTFSAFDDAVVGEAKEVTFALNTKPGDALSAMDKEWKYLALNYLLVGDKKNEKNLTNVEFVWENKDGSKTNNPTTVFHNVPVQRNYRTNILGWLLTNPAEFNISIDEEFAKPDYNMVAVDGTQTAEELAKNSTTDFIDNGQTEVAIIENMHITADETAIVVDDINAPSGTLLVQNSTINAKLFMELNMYYTIIVSNCHLNVDELLKITTGKTAYQIIFSNCYLNGEPMVNEKKSEYFDQNFLSLNTVNISFTNEDNVVVPDNGGDNGDDNQGGEGDDNEGEGDVVVPTIVKFSEIKNTLRKDKDGAYVIENANYDELIIDEEGIGVGLWNVEVKSLNITKSTNSVFYFKNVKFTNKVSGLNNGMNIFVDNCYIGEAQITRDNFKTAFGFEKTGLQYITSFNFSFN